MTKTEASKSAASLKVVRSTYTGMFRDGRLDMRNNNPERREMKCWDVVNTHGAFIAGGLVAGGAFNWTSDKPRFKTKAEALEWIADRAATGSAQ